LVGTHTGTPVAAAVDVVEVRSGDRGRYRAMVLPGLPYFAFACGPAAADGTVPVASPRGWFGAGAVVDLACNSVDAPLVVTVRGVEAWDAEGPLQRFARPCYPGSFAPMPFATANPAAADGAAVWPLLPRGFVELRARNGDVLWEAAAVAVGTAVVTIPPPRLVRCRVVDEQGAPIAGATIHLRGMTSSDGTIDGVVTVRGAYEREVGITGVDGVAELKLPLKEELFQVGSGAASLFVARASGFGEQVSGARGGDFFIDGRKCEPPAVGELPFRLSARPAIQGKVRVGDGLAAPGTIVQLRVAAKLYMGNNSYLHDPRQYSATVSEDGSFTMANVPTDLHSNQWVLQRGLSQPPLLLPVENGRVQPGDIDVRDLAKLSIAVFDVRSGPAAGRAIYLECLGGARASSRDGVLRAVVDSAGRGSVDVRQGDWHVTCFDDESWGTARMVLAEAGEHALEVRLREYPRVHGILSSADGSPVVGAKFELRATRREGGKPEHAVLATWLAKTLPRLVAAAGETAADGSFSLPASPFDSIHVAVRAKFHGRTSEDLDLVVSDPPDASKLVRLQLR
jgi:hypothetical protein